MIIPIRCFTCGKVIGNKWEAYLSLLQADYTEGYISFYVVCVAIIVNKCLFYFPHSVLLFMQHRITDTLKLIHGTFRNFLWQTMVGRLMIRFW